jgi:hypothetical protein
LISGGVTVAAGGRRPGGERLAAGRVRRDPITEQGVP